jgi:TPR repeat protein
LSYNTETQTKLSNKQQQNLNMNNINILSIDNSSNERLSQISQKFFKVNILEIEPKTQDIEKNNFEEDLSILVDNLVNLYFQEINKEKDERVRKNFILDYFSNCKINLQEIYYWLLNNQTYSNSIYLLGYFNYCGIVIDTNKHNSFKLYQKAKDLGNIVAQYELANMYVDGEGTDKDYEKAFELCKKITEGKYSCGINFLGCCYEHGIGTEVNEQRAFELYQKAADLGNAEGINNLGYCYEKGIGTGVNENKAFALYHKVADLGESFGIYYLGNCYFSGIGTLVNYQKAFELYQKAANLKHYVAQYNLGLMYENGYGTEKNIGNAIYWYKKSAKQGYELAQDILNELLI